jgi:hypothetical protein
MEENEVIGHSLREHEKAHGLLCQSTPCECACTGEKERKRDREIANATDKHVYKLHGLKFPIDHWTPVNKCEAARSCNESGAINQTANP